MGLLHAMQTATSGKSTFQLSRLTVFAFLWASVRIFHQLSFPNWLENRDPRDWGLLLLGVMVLLFPRWLPGLLLLLVFSLLHTIAWMPFNPNHVLFEFFSDLGILFGLVYTITKTGAWSRIWRPLGYAESENLFESFAPATRLNLILLYFFATLHKLNWDYLNLDSGCGTVLLQGELDYWLPGFSLPPLGKIIATYGTLVAEAAIPLLLLFPRTRAFGVFFGLLFHFMLSLHPHGGIFSFTSLVYSYLFLFLAPDFTKRLAQVIGNRFNLGKGPQSMAALIHYAFWGALLIGLLVYGFQREDQSSFEFAIGGKPQMSVGTRFPSVFMGAFWMFLGWCLLMMYLFLASGGLQNQADRIEKAFYKPNPAILLVSTLLILVNGFSPYLGLKTHTSFSMFSNIRTEGGINNHLFLPRLPSPWQDDLVTVIDTDASNLKMYRYPGLQVVFFEFRHLASIQKGDFFINYLRDGQRYSFRKEKGQLTGDQSLAIPQPWIARKALRFRPVYPRPCPCQH